MDKGRNEVRVMTVHGAKGLEAPIVFLPDTAARVDARRAGALFRLGDDHRRPPGVGAAQDRAIARSTRRLARRGGGSAASRRSIACSMSP
jgi:ATP-dependent helicase/nuclease subunit A